jgi:hypothetical protein
MTLKKLAKNRERKRRLRKRKKNSRNKSIDKVKQYIVDSGLAESVDKIDKNLLDFVIKKMRGKEDERS